LRRKVAQTIAQAIRQIPERLRRRRELLVQAIEFRNSLR
jgi:phage terminase Nu1 subunit (DNA packaging protein)